MRVAHSPPDCSKHNPLEPHVCPHLTRACQGVSFHTGDIARQCIERAHTTTGLRVTVRMLDTMYQTGRKYTANLRFLPAFGDIPLWNIW
jgi:Rhodopirellula transposase DDE domain